MSFELPAAEKKQELLDLAHDALDEYEGMGSDLSGLVSDLDGVLAELESLAADRRVLELRDAWSRLSVVREETAEQEQSELGGLLVADALHDIRFLLDQ